MPDESPFHTESPEYPPTHRNVYHDNSLCDHGKAIKREHRIHRPRRPAPVHPLQHAGR